MGDQRRNRGGTIPEEIGLAPSTPTTPPVAATALICSSVMFRSWSCRRARIGVTENAGFGRRFHRFKAGLDPAMGAIHDHADTVHSAHDGPPEIRKSLVLIVTTTTRVVVSGCRRSAFAERLAVIEFDHRQIAVQRSHSFDVERQRHFSGIPRR